jgi:hypothetical protein
MPFKDKNRMISYMAEYRQVNREYYVQYGRAYYAELRRPKGRTPEQILKSLNLTAASSAGGVRALKVNH